MSKTNQKYITNSPDPEESVGYRRFGYGTVMYLLGLFIVISAGLTSYFPINNYDIFWHLKTGEHIVAERAVPESDIFSFTAEGRPWITHEWLAELLFYGLYAAGGIKLLLYFKLLIALLIAFLLANHARSRDKANPIVYILIASAVCIGSFRLFVRPHLFTYLFLTIVCINIFNPRYFEKRRSTTLILVPLLFMAWSNIHSGFIIGLGVYWLIAAGELISVRIRKTGKRSSISGSLVKYLVPPGIATLAALVNPNGLEAFKYPFQLAGNPVFRNAIAEMVSPFEIFTTEKLYWLLLVIIIGFAVFGIIRNIRSKPVFSIILLIGVISSLTSIRNSYEFALLTAMASIVTFPKIPRSLEKAGYLTAIVFILLSGYFTTRHIREIRGGDQGVMAELPKGAVDFLNKADYAGNIYAPLGWGGYLIWRGWPEFKVFIDGRLLVYGPDLLNEYHYIRQNEPGALERLAGYGTEAAVLPIGQKRWSVRNAMAVSPDWQLCYFDDKSVVFLIKNDHNREWLKQYGFNKISPLATGYLTREAQRADTAVIVDEALRAYRQAPGEVTTSAVLARAYYLNEDYLSAADYYEKAIKLAPMMTNFIYQVAVSFHRGGKLDSAAVWYNRAIEAMPEYEQSYLEYGAMEAGIGNYQEAIDIWRGALVFNPQSQARNFIKQVQKLMEAAKPDSG